jgi:hypothetical protein
MADNKQFKTSRFAVTQSAADAPGKLNNLEGAVRNTLGVDIDEDYSPIFSVGSESADDLEITRNTSIGQAGAAKNLEVTGDLTVDGDIDFSGSVDVKITDSFATRYRTGTDQAALAENFVHTLSYGGAHPDLEIGSTYLIKSTINFRVFLDDNHWVRWYFYLTDDQTQDRIDYVSGSELASGGAWVVYDSAHISALHYAQDSLSQRVYPKFYFITSDVARQQTVTINDCSLSILKLSYVESTSLSRVAL